MKLGYILLVFATIGFLFTLMYTTEQNRKETQNTVVHYSDLEFHRMNSGKYVEYSPPGHYIVKISLPEFDSDTIYLKVSESAIESRTNLTNYGTKKVQRIKTREEPD